jgi:cob(I)alamin adenosyltransferase
MSEEEENQRGLVIVHTGNGKGKTTAALGMAFRAAGYGYKVLMVQFIKGSWHYGELDAAKKFEGILTIRPMGEGFTWETKNPERDREVAQNAFAYGREEALSGKYHMVIFDEINVAVRYHYVDIEQVLDLIDRKPPSLHLVFTGRDAHPALIERADLVTEMKSLKHPFDKGILAQKGVEF